MEVLYSNTTFLYEFVNNKMKIIRIESSLPCSFS